MEIFKKTTTIDFLGKRRPAMVLSLAALLIALASLALRGLNFGIDFTGGTLIEVGYQQPAELDPIRQLLASGDYGAAMVQHFGSPQDVLIRIAPGAEADSAKASDRLFAELQAAHPEQSLDLRRVEFVGPQVGKELTEKGGLAMLYAVFGILIYVALRFEYRFALGAVIALVHDVIFTLGVFSVFQIEMDLPVLAALLAVIGYSLNDTIVVFDRIRENFRKMRKADAFEVINTSLNQTLSRTLITSGTTLLVLLALFLLGGEIIRGFSLALLIGVVVGTYSSIYVASATLVIMGVSRADMLPVPKEGADGEGAGRP